MQGKQPSDGVRAKQEESHPLDGEAHKDSPPPRPPVGA